jgi:hypothetical protein
MWLLFGALVVLLSLQLLLEQGTRPKEVAYSELLEHLEAGRITSAEVRDRSVIAVLQSGDRISAQRLPSVDDPSFWSGFSKRR